MGFPWDRGELTAGPARLGWGSEGGFHTGQHWSGRCPGWVLTDDPSLFVLLVLGRKGLFWVLGERAGSQAPFPPPTPAMAGPDIWVLLRLLADVQNRKAVNSQKQLEFGRKEGR